MIYLPDIPCVSLPRHGIIEREIVSEILLEKELCRYPLRKLGLVNSATALTVHKIL